MLERLSPRREDGREWDGVCGASGGARAVERARAHHAVPHRRYPRWQQRRAEERGRRRVRELLRVLQRHSRAPREVCGGPEDRRRCDGEARGAEPSGAEGSEVNGKGDGTFSEESSTDDLCVGWGLRVRERVLRVVIPSIPGGGLARGCCRTRGSCCRAHNRRRRLRKALRLQRSSPRGPRFADQTRVEALIPPTIVRSTPPPAQVHGSQPHSGHG